MKTFSPAGTVGLMAGLLGTCTYPGNEVRFYTNKPPESLARLTIDEQRECILVALLYANSAGLHVNVTFPE
jgi:hypothetical protein